MNVAIKRIRGKVLQLQELYWKRGKKFYYNLPLEEEEIQAFENLNNVTLPDGYRDFIKYIGNGEGPEDRQLFAWNPTKKVKDLDQPWCDPEIYNRADEKYSLPDSDEINPNPNLTPEEKEARKAGNHGTLPIFDAGCGAFYFLVITGPKRGEIWIDTNAGGGGFRYCWKSFLGYYGPWLDSKINARKTDLKVNGGQRKPQEEASLQDLTTKATPHLTVTSKRFDVGKTIYRIRELIDKNQLNVALHFCEQVSDENLVLDFCERDEAWKKWAVPRERNIPEQFNDLLSNLHYHWAVICIKTENETGARNHYELFKKYKGKLFLIQSILQKPHFGLNEAILAVNHRLSGFALEILEECEKVLDRDDRRQLWWNLRGCAYDQLREYEKALQAFQKSYSFKHWIVPYDNQCRVLIQLGQLTEAEKIVSTIKSHSPLYEWCYYGSAFLELKKGKPEIAKRELQKAFELGLKKDLVDEPELKELMKEAG